MKAWHLYWNDMWAIYRAETRQQAKALGAKTLAEFWPVTFEKAAKEISCRRAPEHDGEGSEVVFAGFDGWDY